MKTPLQQIQSIFDYLPSTASDGQLEFKSNKAGQHCDDARAHISRLQLPLKAVLVSGCEFKVEEVE